MVALIKVVIKYALLCSFCRILSRPWMPISLATAIQHANVPSAHTEPVMFRNWLFALK